MKNKIKRILALLLAIGLFSLYVVTIVVACTGSPNKDIMLKACIYSTVVIPIFLWAYALIYRLLKSHFLPTNDDKTNNVSNEKQ